MKNRIIRVSIITIIVYFLYIFFFQEDLVDTSVEQNQILIEQNEKNHATDLSLENKDTIQPDSIEIIKKNTP